MTKNRIQRTLRMSALSTFLALVALFFLAFGSASAQTVSSSTTTLVKIVANQQGGAVFSPTAITVKSGTPVKFVNKLSFRRFFTVNQRLTSIAPNQAETFIITQSQVATICGGGSMTLTVV